MAALLATALDFFVLVMLTEVLHLWYLFSAFIGALTGGIVAFILGRNWIFMKHHGKISFQAIKYLMSWGVSILLNTMGLYFVVEQLGYQYIISKVIVAIVIGVGFNFFTHKYFIFR